MKQLLKNSFLQLVVVYTILVAIINFGFVDKYVLHFEIFALILAVLGVFIIKSGSDFKIKPIILIFPVVLIIMFRIIPYLRNSVPLGYDPGIYKYIIETYQQNLPDLPK